MIWVVCHWECKGEQGLVGLRAEFSQLLLGRVGLCGIELLMGLLELDCLYMVFLMASGRGSAAWRGGVQCDAGETRGSWKVMHLAVFLKLTWAMDSWRG